MPVKSDFRHSMLRTGRPDFDGVSAKTVVVPLASVSVLAALRLRCADCVRVFPGRERCADAREERGTVSAASSSTTHTDRPTLGHRRPPPYRRTKRHRRPLRRRPYPGRTPSAWRRPLLRLNPVSHELPLWTPYPRPPSNTSANALCSSHERIRSTLPPRPVRRRMRSWRRGAGRRQG